jgi:hypothetical protein
VKTWTSVASCASTSAWKWGRLTSYITLFLNHIHLTCQQNYVYTDIWVYHMKCSAILINCLNTKMTSTRKAFDDSSYEYVQMKCHAFQAKTSLNFKIFNNKLLTPILDNTEHINLLYGEFWSSYVFIYLLENHKTWYNNNCTKRAIKNPIDLFMYFITKWYGSLKNSVIFNQKTSTKMYMLSAKRIFIFLSNTVMYFQNARLFL